MTHPRVTVCLWLSCETEVRLCNRNKSWHSVPGGALSLPVVDVASSHRLALSGMEKGSTATLEGTRNSRGVFSCHKGQRATAGIWWMGPDSWPCLGQSQKNYLTTSASKAAVETIKH